MQRFKTSCPHHDSIRHLNNLKWLVSLFSNLFAIIFHIFRSFFHIFHNFSPVFDIFSTFSPWKLAFNTNFSQVSRTRWHSPGATGPTTVPDFYIASTARRGLAKSMGIHGISGRWEISWISIYHMIFTYNTRYPIIFVYLYIYMIYYNFFYIIVYQKYLSEIFLGAQIPPDTEFWAHDPWQEPGELRCPQKAVFYAKGAGCWELVMSLFVGFSLVSHWFLIGFSMVSHWFSISQNRWRREGYLCLAHGQIESDGPFRIDAKLSYSRENEETTVVATGGWPWLWRRTAMDGHGRCWCVYPRKLTGFNDKLLNLVKCDESIQYDISKEFRRFLWFLKQIDLKIDFQCIFPIFRGSSRRLR